MEKANKRILFLSLVMGCFLVGCGSVPTLKNTEESVVITEENNEWLYITKEDRKIEGDNPVVVDLTGIEEAYVIEDAGEYILSGDCRQAIVVDVHDQIVHLYLDNLNVQTTSGPAIDIVSGGKVIITLMDGTLNTLFDAAYYRERDINATISAACDLTINGNGVLYVCGYYKDAIHTKDVCKILGGTVQLKAKRCGLKGNDGIVLSPAVLVVESEKIGFQTKNADKDGNGIIEVSGGDISVVAGEYGFASAGDIRFMDGQIHVKSVIRDIYTEGRQYIAEGVLVNE